LSRRLTLADGVEVARCGGGNSYTKAKPQDDEGKCAFHAAQLLSLPFRPTSTTSLFATETTTLVNTTTIADP
jgi:hypothetical protein